MVDNGLFRDIVSVTSKHMVPGENDYLFTFSLEHQSKGGISERLHTKIIKQLTKSGRFERSVEQRLVSQIAQNPEEVSQKMVFLDDSMRVHILSTEVMDTSHVQIPGYHYNIHLGVYKTEVIDAPLAKIDHKNVGVYRCDKFRYKTWEYNLIQFQQNSGDVQYLFELVLRGKDIEKPAKYYTESAVMKLLDFNPNFEESDVP